MSVEETDSQADWLLGLATLTGYELLCGADPVEWDYPQQAYILIETILQVCHLQG